MKALKKKRFSPHRLKRTGTAFLFLLPAILLFVYFKFYPMYETLYGSFFRYNIVNPDKSIYVGLKNYANALSSDLFWLSVKNAAILFLWGLVLGFWVPILQALCIHELIRGKGIARLCYLIPTALSGFAGLSVWKYMWEPDGGLANMFVGLFGLGPYQWYGSEALVKFCLRFPAILGGGGTVIIFLVAMENISAELYEAAKIDGANIFRRIWHITLPGARYTIFLIFLMGLTGSLLAFDDVYMLTQGGPGYSSFTVVFGIYTKAFRENNFGLAMAMSLILCLMILVITAIVYGIQGKMQDDY